MDPKSARLAGLFDRPLVLDPSRSSSILMGLSSKLSPLATECYPALGPDDSVRREGESTSGRVGECPGMGYLLRSSRLIRNDITSGPRSVGPGSNPGPAAPQCPVYTGVSFCFGRLFPKRSRPFPADKWYVSGRRGRDPYRSSRWYGPC
jgi:hypothetical protein